MHFSLHLSLSFPSLWNIHLMGITMSKQFSDSRLFSVGLNGYEEEVERRREKKNAFHHRALTSVSCTQLTLVVINLPFLYHSKTENSILLHLCIALVKSFLCWQRIQLILSFAILNCLSKPVAAVAI